MTGEFNIEIDSNDIGQVVVINEKEEVLLLLRSPEMPWAANRWALPGGHIYFGENKKHGAARETFEETNLICSNLKRFEKQEVTDGDQKKVLFFYWTHDFKGDIELNFEHTDYKWININDLDSIDVVENVKSKLLDLFTIVRFNKRENNS